MRKVSVLLLLGLGLAAGSALAANEIVVTEVMYNSVESTDVEYIELYNNSGSTVDLTNWYVLDDNASHNKVYLSGTMAPGEVKVLAGTLSLFTAKYPTVTNIFPVGYQPAPWDLGNGGDTVNLYNASGTLVCSVLFDDAAPWPTSPDGSGPALELANIGCTNFSDASCWQASVYSGTPGTVNFVVGIAPSTWSALKELYQ
jgi:hypothetical protein